MSRESTGSRGRNSCDNDSSRSCILEFEEVHGDNVKGRDAGDRSAATAARPEIPVSGASSPLTADRQPSGGDQQQRCLHVGSEGPLPSDDRPGGRAREGEEHCVRHYDDDGCAAGGGDDDGDVRYPIEHPSAPFSMSRESWSLTDYRHLVQVGSDARCTTYQVRPSKIDQIP